jgi:general nucleoside transport system permease protein
MSNQEAPGVVRAWRRLSPSLVPVFAVVTALVVAIPLLIVTVAGGSVGRGLWMSHQAYAALLEGALGVAINTELEMADVDTVLTLAESEEITRRDLLRLSRQTEDLLEIGQSNVREFNMVIQRYLGTEALPDDEAFDTLGEQLARINDYGAEWLQESGDLLLALDELSRSDVRDVAERYAAFNSLDDSQRAELVEFVPQAADYSDDQLLDILVRVNNEGNVRLVRAYAQLATLDALGLSVNDDDADAIRAIHANSTANTPGVELIRELAEINDRLRVAGGTDDIERLSNQFRLVSSLYSEDILTDDNVALALNEELPLVLDESLLVRRPNNRVLMHVGVRETTGLIENNGGTPDDPDDDVPEAVYLRLFGQVFLFFPASLEATLTRSIPFIIAGLAVTVGFKAGLFNIGAEGQLYAGSIFAVWFGFTEPFTSLPAFLLIPLILAAGVVGGAFWGMIPGVLKAFTGAHEVINTIMLNFIAIRMVDWLIKSTDPVILLDTEASTPRTPIIDGKAMLTTFDNMSVWVFLLAGVLTAAFMLYRRREQLSAITAIRPVVYGVLVAVGGIFLSWTSVRGNLHIGFLVMIATVYFVAWFLDRTTLGFELRTVGANTNAARYAGMNVRQNIVLAMTLSGGLAGLAGIIEIAGVQHNMQPEFFAGLGFDSIAVALLARNNPRNMIPAGLLWGGLLAGAGLMQIRADISIDLVKIIQALIIMFIAADGIIRTVWRVPEATAEEKAAAQFSTGWGG